MRSVRFLPLVLAACLLTAGAASAQDHTCVLTMSVIDEADLNNLDFKLFYDDADGEIEGSGSSAQCERLLPGTGALAANDNDATDTLSIALVQLSTFSGPAELAACQFFYDTDPPGFADFSITVTNAGVGGEDDNVHPRPRVRVTDIDCPGIVITTTTVTTTSTTSTTLPPSCGIVVTGGEKPTASDALAALRAAVGSFSCELCICDVDDSGGVTATDALMILRAAVGLSSNLDCPACV